MIALRKPPHFAVAFLDQLFQLTVGNFTESDMPG